MDFNHDIELKHNEIEPEEYVRPFRDVSIVRSVNSEWLLDSEQEDQRIRDYGDSDVYRWGKWCFLCDRTPVQSDVSLATATDYNEIEKLIEDNIHTTGEEALCSMIFEMYEFQYRTYVEESDGKPRPWSRKAIHEHLTNHAPSSKIQARHNMRELALTIRTIENGGLYVQDRRTGTRGVDVKQAEILIKLMKEMREQSKFLES